MDGMDFDFDFDIDGFDFDFNLDDIDINSGKQKKNRFILPKPHKETRSIRVKYNHAKDMINDCGDYILAGDKVHAIVSGNFIFGDFIEAFAVEHNLLIDDLTLSTLSISQENVDSLHNLIAGDYLKNLNIIVSDYFWSHNRHNAPYIYEKLDIDNRFQLAVAGTNTKVTLLKIGDKKIVIKGSANFRSSRCVEEFTIESCDDLYDFHKQWHDKIIEDYGTIKKSIRGNSLFDKITKGVEGKKGWHQK